MNKKYTCIKTLSPYFATGNKYEVINIYFFTGMFALKDNFGMTFYIQKRHMTYYFKEASCLLPEIWFKLKYTL